MNFKNIYEKDKKKEKRKDNDKKNKKERNKSKLSVASNINKKDSQISNDHNDLKYLNQINQSYNIKSDNFYDHAQKKQFENDINKNNNEKCDGCFIENANKYCTNCLKSYCKLCDDHIHTIPRLKLHNRVELKMMFTLKKLCYNHNLKLNYYCETCEETICKDCNLLGPHNTRLHRVIDILDSFMLKFKNLKIITNGDFDNIYKLYLDQIGYMEFNIEEIKKHKAKLEKEIQIEYLTIIDRLKAHEGKKMAVLNFNSNEIQKQINIIQDICNYVHNNNISNKPDVINFLLEFNKTSKTLNELVNKKHNYNINVETDDFINDICERKIKVDKFNIAEKVLEQKDSIIWSLIQEKKIKEEREYALIKEQVKNEISDWKNVSDKYSIQLEEYILVCFFCGCFLDSDTINDQCQANFGIIDCKLEVTYSDTIVSTDKYNNRRHYYAKPSKNYYYNLNNLINKKYRNEYNNDRNNTNFKNLKTSLLSNNSIINNESHKEQFIKQNLHKQSFDNAANNRDKNIEINRIKEKINYIAKKAGLITEEFFCNYFKNKKKTTYEELRLILSTKFKLSNEECNLLLSQIINKEHKLNNNNFVYNCDNEKNMNNSNNTNMSNSNLNKSIYSKNITDNLNLFEKNANNSLSNDIMIKDFINILMSSNKYKLYCTNKSTMDKLNIHKKIINIQHNNLKKENKLDSSIEENNKEYNIHYNNNYKSTNPLKNQQEKLQEIINEIIHNIKLSNFNLYKSISDEDKDCDGIVSKEEIKNALYKININLDSFDIENLLNYFNINSNNIVIYDFTKLIIKESEKVFQNQII